MFLHKKGKHTYTELRRFTEKEGVHISQRGFEIKVLVEASLIYKDNRFGLYDLTDVGRSALDLAIQLSKVMKKIEDTEDYDDIPACLKMLPPMELKQ